MNEREKEKWFELELRKVDALEILAKNFVYYLNLMELIHQEFRKK
jgi:hypothetical protein